MGLKVWLPFTDGTLKNQGSANITATGTNITVNNNGKLGKCCSFRDSTNFSYIMLSEAPFNNDTTEWSYTCWLNPQDPGSNYHCLFSNRTVTSENGYAIFVGTASTYAGHIYFDTGKRFDAAITTPLNTWTHLAFTFKRNVEKKIYVNGVLVASASDIAYNSTVPTSANATNAVIGGSQSASTTVNANYMKGQLNDVRIYDHCLSAAEVKDIARGLLVHYPMTHYSHGYGNPNLCNNSKTFGTGWTGTGTIHADKFAGFAVKYKDNTSGTSYTDIVRYPNVVTASQGQIFTASFWAKADSQHDIRCYFYNNTSGVVGVVSGVSSIGTTTTSVDGQIVLTVPTEWKHFWITWTMNGSTGTSALRELLIGRNNAGQSGVYIAGVKLEEGNADTGWAPSLTDAPGEFSGMQDNSGFGHGGTLNTNIRFTFNSAMRHGYGARLIADTILTPSTGIKTADNIFSFNVWLYVTATKTGSKIINLRLNNNLMFNFGRNASSTSTAYQFFLFHPSYYIGIGATMDFNAWHMWTGTYDGTTSKLYKDGVLQTTQTSHTSYTVTTDDKQEFLGTSSSGSDSCIVSDLRVYSTCLSATDIMELYKVNTRVDNKGNLHAYDLYENVYQKIQNNGVFESKYFSEFCPSLKYDKNIYVEPDGSKWVRVVHHDNPNTRRFASTDDFAHGVYYNEYLWYDMEQVVQQLSSYEFIAEQALTSGDTVTRYRWVQNVSPIGATWDQTKAANVTKVTNGYDTNSYHGGIRITTGSARCCIANATSSNWFGAYGSWTLYQNGTPGFPNVVVTTGYMDLYVRIDNNNLNMGASFHKNGTINANQLIEI